MSKYFTTNSCSVDFEVNPLDKQEGWLQTIFQAIRSFPFLACFRNTYSFEFQKGEKKTDSSTSLSASTLASSHNHALSPAISPTFMGYENGFFVTSFALVNYDSTSQCNLDLTDEEGKTLKDLEDLNLRHHYVRGCESTNQKSHLDDYEMEDDDFDEDVNDDDYDDDVDNDFDEDINEEIEDFIDEMATSKSKDTTLFTISSPRVKWDDVIINDTERDKILQAIDWESHLQVENWGIKPNLAMSSSQSIKILLHGPSGTGKTMLADAIADLLQAEIFGIKIHNILDKYVGNSEKKVKALFEAYRKLYEKRKKENKTLIFVINEADQLFSTRVPVKSGLDSTFNTLQNIILEEMEHFEGILVATTNLLINFDEALDRRFTHIIKIDIPDAKHRLSIWKKHFAKAPLDPKLSKDLNNIAKLYPLTGGQIANIVFKAACRAAYRATDKEKTVITEEDVLLFIQDTLQTRNHDGLQHSIGFKSSSKPFLTVDKREN
ncbi:MAG: ATP-binding protein [Brevinematales bacterium]